MLGPFEMLSDSRFPIPIPVPGPGSRRQNHSTCLHPATQLTSPRPRRSVNASPSHEHVDRSTRFPQDDRGALAAVGTRARWRRGRNANRQSPTPDVVASPGADAFVEDLAMERSTLPGIRSSYADVRIGDIAGSSSGLANGR